MSTINSRSQRGLSAPNTIKWSTFPAPQLRQDHTMTDESLHVLQAGHEGRSARTYSALIWAPFYLSHSKHKSAAFILFFFMCCLVCSLLSRYCGALFPHNKALLFLKGPLMWKINVKRYYTLNVCNERKLRNWHPRPILQLWLHCPLVSVRGITCGMC